MSVATSATSAATSAFAGPSLGPVPVEFLLFAVVLTCVALFHAHTMRTAIVGARRYYN